MIGDALHTVVPETIHLADDGTLFFYFSEALDSKDQKTLQAFAIDYVINEGGPLENNVNIVVDLPAMIEDMLDGGYCETLPSGKFLAPADKRVAFESVRKQLLDSIELLDKIVYEEACCVWR